MLDAVKGFFLNINELGLAGYVVLLNLWAIVKFFKFFENLNRNFSKERSDKDDTFLHAIKDQKKDFVQAVDNNTRALIILNSSLKERNYLKEVSKNNFWKN